MREGLSRLVSLSVVLVSSLDSHSHEIPTIGGRTKENNHSNKNETGKITKLKLVQPQSSIDTKPLRQWKRVQAEIFGNVQCAYIEDSKKVETVLSHPKSTTT